MQGAEMSAVLEFHSYFSALTRPLIYFYTSSRHRKVNLDVHIKIFKLHFINVLIPYGYNGIMHFHVIIIDFSIIAHTLPAHTDPNVFRYQVKSKDTPMGFFCVF